MESNDGNNEQLTGFGWKVCSCWNRALQEGLNNENDLRLNVGYSNMLRSLYDYHLVFWSDMWLCATKQKWPYQSTENIYPRSVTTLYHWLVQLQA